MRFMGESARSTRLERILGVQLSEDAVRQWPQSGELIRGRSRIADVESHFVGSRLGVGRRHACGNTVVVEWSTDYGEGRIHRNVSIAELENGMAVRVTDYWGEPFTPPVRLRLRLRGQRHEPPRVPSRNTRAGFAMGDSHEHTPDGHRRSWAHPMVIECRTKGRAAARGRLDDAGEAGLSRRHLRPPRHPVPAGTGRLAADRTRPSGLPGPQRSS
ncbi:hypothetical protein ACIBJD_22025 [Kitasatospora sp. NPDC050467]|uniref:hypothetical protein n=1 Tax=Kitasatospora sp. NPDC050467 TaxID=3364053 RepID=UPI0037A75014